MTSQWDQVVSYSNINTRSLILCLVTIRVVNVNFAIEVKHNLNQAQFLKPKFNPSKNNFVQQNFTNPI